MKKILALLGALALAKADPVRTKLASYDETDPKQAPIICALTNSDDILVAHEHCNQYYQCWNGKPVVRSCYGTLQYNPAIEACDWPTNVDCGTRTIPEATEGHEHDTPEEAQDICSSDGSEGLLVVHKNCNHFHKCHEGKAVSYKCPGHLLFNNILGYCDCASEVVCGDRVVTEEEGSNENGTTEIEDTNTGDDENNDPSKAPKICASENSDGILVAHENCNKFYKCDHGYPVEFKCYGNLLFDPAIERCEWPENVECVNRTISENESAEDGGLDSGDTDSLENGAGGNCDHNQADDICASEGSDGTLVAHKNCNKYYICSLGVPVVQSCPGNLLFNPTKDYCDWPENVNCKGEDEGNNSEGSDNEDTDNEGTDSGSGNGGGNDNEESDNGVGGTCNCNPGEAPVICASDGSEGVFIAHENCNQFYVCVGGKPVNLSCPSNTLYNPHTETCDWPANVQCGDRVVPEDCDDENNSNGENGEDDDNEGSDNNGGNDNNEGNDNGGSDNGVGGTCNCNPGEAPEICAADGSDGVFVAHENCNQFYTCVGGKPVTISCPSNTLYNPYLKQCDWPDNVQCGERVIPEDCDDENNSNGENGEDDDHEGSDNNGGNDNNEGNDNGGSDNGVGGTCNCNPGEAPEICAADGSDGVFVAHENCNQFYTCVGGKPVTISCPSNTLYNPYLKQCDWPDNVQCGERVIPEDCDDENNSNGENGEDDDNEGSDNNGGNDNNEGNDNGGSDNGVGGTCNCNPGEAPEICAADGSDGVFVAHENCNQFYTCVGAKPVTISCPSNTLYNPYLKQCDWPDNVQCGERVIPEDYDDENNSNGENGEDDDNEGSDNNGGNDNNEGNDNGGSDNGVGGTCNCNPGEASEICAADGSDGVFVAHENCNQFYTCVGGKPVTISCPSNTLYNPYLKQCDWPDSVQCGERVIPEDCDDENNSNGGNGDNDDNGEDDDNEGNDNNGGNDNNEGNDNGGSDNGVGGTCNCNPGEAPEICAADGSDGVFVAHENCNQFYTCVGGKPVTISCPSNTLYNPYLKQCDWPDSVQCGERVIPEDRDDENNSNGGNGDNDDNGEDDDNEGNDNNGGNDNGGSDSGVGGICNCNPGEAPEICAADGSDGVFVAHENCNQFYTCVGGKPVTISCPSNTLYNPHLKKCDWPDSVQCGDRVIPEDCDDENNSNGGNGEDDDNEGNDNNGGNDNNEGNDNGGSDNGVGGTCNCNPGEAPEICAADGSDGVFVAHENCNQFYTCVGGKPVTISCPSNTLYNPYLKQCDWPDSVQCGERVIPEDRDDENNSNGGNGDNDDNGEDDDNEGNDNNGGNDNNEGNDNGGSDNGVGGICNCNPGEAPEICAADGSDGVFVAHENCNQFYTCVGGKPVTISCPSNTLYNPYLKKCDWPDSVQCGERVIPEDCDDENNSNGGNGEDDDNEGNDNNGGNDNNEGNDNGGSDNGVGGTCNCNPGEAPEICAADGSDGVFVAHENCNQFYTCVGGKPVTISCPSNTLYNPYLKQCDWPDSVQCGERVIPEDRDDENNSNGGNGDNDDNGEDDDNEGNDNNGGSDNGVGGICNCDPGEAPEICAADGSDGVFVAHENCNQFYTCVGGKPVTISCPSNTLYNPYLKKCDWPDSVQCGERVIPEDCDDESNSNGGNGDNDDNEGNDNNGGNDNNEGNDNGGSDNGGGGTCNCIPSEAPEICATDGSEGVYVAHENCNQFYTCIGGKPVTIKCASNTLYNPYTEQCDWPFNVECGDRVIPEDNDDENSNNGNGDNNDGNDNNGDNDNNEGNGSGGSDNGGSGTCNCNPSEAPKICATDGSEGVFVAHEHCNQFYTCLGGKPVTLSCPTNTLYNPYTEICDWPANVQCGDRVVLEDGGNNNNEDGGNNNNDGNGDNNGNENNDDSGGNESNDNGGSDNGGSGTCNCIPSKAPEICAAVGSEGVCVAHENCNQFYTCVGGIPVTVKCPSNTLYNPYTEQCDWPFNVQCGDRLIPESSDDENNSKEVSDNNDGQDGGGTDIEEGVTCNCNPSEAPEICAAAGSDGVYVAHENCNEFYTCIGGQSVTQRCAGITLYNPYTQQCDWPDNVKCGDRVILEDHDDENNSNEVNDNNDGQDGGGSDNDEGVTCNCNPSEAPEICSAAGSDGVYIAHENCNEFYTCVRGQPVTQRCAGITLYNPYTQQCDWPDNVICGERVTPVDSEENYELDNWNPAKATEICARDGSNGAYVAHENCNQFYTCLEGKPITVTCAGITLYNPFTQRCDWPDNVSCGDRVISEDDNTDTNGDNSGDDDTGNVVDVLAVCAKSGSEGLFLPHEKCNQFYVCLESKPVTMNCPGALLYNPDTDQCDWPNNVDCGSRDNANENNIMEEDDEIRIIDAKGEEDENENITETDDFGYDVAVRRCSENMAGGVQIPHEECHRFYVCLSNRPLVFTCASNNLYDTTRNQCNYPENVDCGNRIRLS